MAVMLVSSFVVVLAPVFGGLVWMFNRIADYDRARKQAGAPVFAQRLKRAP